VSPPFAAASWPTRLTAVSTIAPIVLFVVFFFGGRTLADDPVGRVVKPAIFYVPFVLLIVALLFIVSGYEVDRTELRIRRLLWSTVIPLQGLTRVWYDPEAMRKSLRVVGNGGLFSFSGIYQSKTLGRYRAFVTDPRSAVVLVLLNRTVVITPGNPDSFVAYVRNLFPSVEGKPPQDPVAR
jgi:Bacterial PH domain